MTNADGAAFDDIVANMLDMICDHILALQRRTLALQTIMERARLTTPAEVDAAMRALDDAATTEIEFAPEYEESAAHGRRFSDGSPSSSRRPRNQGTT